MENVKIQKKERVYSGWINVNVVHMQLPDGTIIQREVAQRKNWVAVVAITDDNKVIMVKQPRAGIERFSLEVIAGNVDERHHGDDKLAAMDELREEAGVDPNKCKWTDLGLYMPDPAYCTSIAHLYLAENANQTMELQTEEGEVIENVLIPFSEAINIVKDGFDTRIWDANSTIALLRAEKYLNK